MRFISVKTDFGFKKVFASPQSKNVLISFLNAMIYDGQPTIEDLEIIDPYAAGTVTGLKDSYLDVKAKITGNKTVIIEMQVINVSAFTKRVVYNAAKTYATQLKPREGYSKLNPIIALTITDFVLFKNNDKLISHFVFQELENKFEYPEREIELVFVELPKFNQELEQLENLSQSWAYFIKNVSQLEQIPEELSSVVEIQTAFELANRANLTLDELEKLEKREMFFEDQKGSILKGIEDGRILGIKQGIIEGKSSLILRQISRLLGEISSETQASIRQLNSDQLENLGEAVLDFKTVEDLLVWLSTASEL